MPILKHVGDLLGVLLGVSLSLSGIDFLFVNGTLSNHSLISRVTWALIGVVDHSHQIFLSIFLYSWFHKSEACTSFWIDSSFNPFDTSTQCRFSWASWYRILGLRCTLESIISFLRPSLYFFLCHPVYPRNLLETISVWDMLKIYDITSRFINPFQHHMPLILKSISWPNTFAVSLI
jgi:hypothetical protein